MRKSQIEQKHENSNPHKSIILKHKHAQSSQINIQNGSIEPIFQDEDTDKLFSIFSNALYIAEESLSVVKSSSLNNCNLKFLTLIFQNTIEIISMQLKLFSASVY
jgi:hypothetical protein